MSSPDPLPPSLARAGRHLPGWAKRRAKRALGRGGPESPYRRDPRSLDEIGLETGTDKSTARRSYLPVYDGLLQHLRDSSFALVEIGVGEGASLSMWAAYFHRARITGIDKKSTSKQYATDRIRIVRADQSDEAALSRVAVATRPLVVVDDGSHVWSHQMLSLRTFFPALREGGYLLLEDVHTSFGDEYTARYGQGDETSPYDYLARVARSVTAAHPLAGPPVDAFEIYCRAWVEWVLFLKHAVVVKKRDTPRSEVLAVADLTQVAATGVVTQDLAPYARVEPVLDGASEEVAESLADLVSAPVVLAPASSGIVADAVVVGSGQVVTSEGRILDETLNCARNVQRVPGLYRPYDERTWVNEVDLGSAAVVSDQRVHVLLKHTWDANYGHWLVDALPRLSQVDRVARLADCVVLVNDQTEPMRRVVLDSLALAGVAEDQVDFTGAEPRRYPRLVVLGNLSRHPYTKSVEAIEYLERITEPVPASGDDRVYLSRSRSRRRRLLNEAEVAGVLQKWGYRTVHCEDLSLREQIAVLKGASYVVGDLGAAMANVAFSPRGVSVLALTTPAMSHDFFYDLVCIKGGRYVGLQGVADVPEPTLDTDFVVTAERLEDALRRWHGSPASA